MNNYTLYGEFKTSIGYYIFAVDANNEGVLIGCNDLTIEKLYPDNTKNIINHWKYQKVDKSKFETQLRVVKTNLGI